MWRWWWKDRVRIQSIVASTWCRMGDWLFLATASRHWLQTASGRSLCRTPWRHVVVYNTITGLCHPTSFRHIILEAASQARVTISSWIIITILLLASIFTSSARRLWLFPVGWRQSMFSTIGTLASAIVSELSSNFALLAVSRSWQHTISTTRCNSDRHFFVLWTISFLVLRRCYRWRVRNQTTTARISTVSSLLRILRLVQVIILINHLGRLLRLGWVLAAD